MAAWARFIIEPKMFPLFLFFFQAEDGIRDLIVTGVQTCALPISRRSSEPAGGVSVAASSLSPKAPGWFASGRKYRAIRRSSADCGPGPCAATGPYPEIGRASCRERG